ncbi:hypothetical protein GWI33_008794 [Rhynchophorus ferrugineus]|uniref:Uncharacterized protein n=1 Tax=Rhynchophorus ferrugineus TaxID=354439 RepID=A0A834IB04_RHYFE|nr:hypothetical protein GWI33_008794 [Rhynchophorus ferrugineus]
MASQIGLPEVASDNHNQVNWKQMFEESRKDIARLQEQVAHLSTQIEEPTKTSTENRNIQHQLEWAIKKRNNRRRNQIRRRVPNTQYTEEIEAHTNEPPREKTKVNHCDKTVTHIHTSNPPRKNQPLSRSLLTPTAITSGAAKPANFKTPKQPLPKILVEATESSVSTRKRNFSDQKSTNAATETPISNSNATTSPSTSKQPPLPPQSK